MKKAQSGAKVKKTVTKPKEDKYKGLGGEIGRPIFSDKEQRERRKKLGLPTSKAEEKAYYDKMAKEGAKNGKTMTKAQNGIKQQPTVTGTLNKAKKSFSKKEMDRVSKITSKTLSKAKNGKSFPDLNKDGKITRADILKGRGVIAKSGTTIKKAQNGRKTDANTTIQKAKLDNKYNKIYATMKRDSTNYSNENIVPAVYNYLRKKTGKSPSAESLRSRTDQLNKIVVKDSKANKGNTKLDARGRTENAMNRYKKGGAVKKMAKSGASMKKCRYGCK